jgi:hypothetical protein
MLSNSHRGSELDEAVLGPSLIDANALSREHVLEQSFAFTPPHHIKSLRESETIGGTVW